MTISFEDLIRAEQQRLASERAASSDPTTTSGSTQPDASTSPSSSRSGTPASVRSRPNRTERRQKRAKTTKLNRHAMSAERVNRHSHWRSVLYGQLSAGLGGLFLGWPAVHWAHANGLDGNPRALEGHLLLLFGLAFVVLMGLILTLHLTPISTLRRRREDLAAVIAGARPEEKAEFDRRRAELERGDEG